jgi:hypothetical protein
MPTPTKLQDLLTLCRPPVLTLDPWVGAPNSWVRSLAPVVRGQIADDMYIRLRGGRRIGNNRAGYDIENGALKVESKLSTRSYSGTNCYLWNQIRPADPYTHLWLVAIGTHDVQAFFIPRASVPSDRLWKQHGREAGEENTYVLKTSAGEVIPPWMKPFAVLA